MLATVVLVTGAVIFQGEAAGIRDAPPEERGKFAAYVLASADYADKFCNVRSDPVIRSELARLMPGSFADKEAAIDEQRNAAARFIVDKSPATFCDVTLMEFGPDGFTIPGMLRERR